MSQFAPVGLRVPSGFEQLLESLAKEILRVQPTDITSFAADYFRLKLAQREERSNRFNENDLSNNSEVLSSKDPMNSTSVQDNFPDPIQSIQQEVTVEPVQASGPPSPCSEDDDPNSEIDAPKLLESEKLGSAHSVVEKNSETNLDGTEAVNYTEAIDLNTKSTPLESDPIASESEVQIVPDETKTSSDNIDEISPQIPVSDPVEEIVPQPNDQESVPPADSDPDLSNSLKAEENDEDAGETEHKSIDPLENSEEQQ